VGKIKIAGLPTLGVEDLGVAFIGMAKWSRGGGEVDYSY